MNINRHEELLTALYKRSVVPPVPSKAKFRFRLESDRRLLDLCRIIWRRWPLTALYGRACYGDHLVVEPTARIPTLLNRSKNIEQAIEFAFDLWLNELEDTVFKDLKNYDDARHGRSQGTREPSANERIALDDILTTDFRIMESDYDIIAFGRTLSYYGELHAPDCLIRSLRPTQYGNSVFAFYTREGKIYAANVTPILCAAGQYDSKKQ